MRKKSGKPLKIIAGIMLALVLLAFVVPFLIPMESYKAEVIRNVKAATGRDLTIVGPVHLSLFPGVRLHMERVALSNPKGYSTPEMLSVGSATVHVALLPLLSGHAHVSKLELDKPVISLEVNAQGVPNWRFTPPDQVPEAPTRHSQNLSLIGNAQAAQPAPNATNSALNVLQHLWLGDVRIEGGSVRYVDVPAKKTYAFTALNLSTALKGPDAPFALAGDMQFNGQKTTFEAEINTPQGLLAGTGAQVRLNVEAAPLHITLEGQSGLLSGKGKLTLNTPSLPGIGAWVNGTPASWKGSTPLAFSMNGDLSCNPMQCTAENTNLKLDGMAFSGKLAASWVNAVPYVAASLSTAALDLTPYMAKPEKKPVASPPAAKLPMPAPAAPEGWSTEPMDFSGLKAANADIQLTANKVSAKQFKLGRTTFAAALKDGQLRITPTADLYGGKGSSEITVDARAAVPQFGVRMTLAAVQAEPLLKDTSGFDRLSGKMDFSLSAAAQGVSMHDIIGALNGSGQFSLANGALKGINIAQLGRNVQGLLSGVPTDKTPQQTDFSSLSGTYTITSGIVKNGDLAMLSPMIRVKGAGNIDLPNRYVNYRLEPQIVSTLTGQGGKSKSGVGIPVIVKGPFDHVTYTPDIKGAAQDLLKNPDAVKNTAKSLKDQIKKSGGVQNMLQGIR